MAASSRPTEVGVEGARRLGAASGPGGWEQLWGLLLGGTDTTAPQVRQVARERERGGRVVLGGQGSGRGRGPARCPLLTQAPGEGRPL